MTAEAGQWLAYAAENRQVAALCRDSGLFNPSLQNSQQAVEKALKAFLAFHERTFRKTHDLGDLSPECLAIDESLQEAISQAEGLTQYAWRFRYPGAPYEPDSTEAQDGLRRAEAAIQEVERRLPAAT